MKPICVPCQRFYHPKRNGFYFLEGMPVDPSVPPGLARPDLWKPYKLWCGDLWECKGCGHQTISGAGFEPVTEHYELRFADLVKASDAQFQVNDC